MKAGKLRQKIDIGNFSTVSDGAGGTIPTLRVDKSVWGEIIPISGSRELESNKINIEQMYDVRLRYNDYPMLSKINRLGYEGRTFTIHSIIVINERKKEFKLKVYEDGANDLYLYNENFEFITDESGNKITI